MYLRHLSFLIPYVICHYANGKGQNLGVSRDFRHKKINSIKCYIAQYQK